MTSARLRIRFLLPLAISLGVHAQEATPVPAAVPTPHRVRTPKVAGATFNPGVVLLDPGHGGDDAGARLGGNNLEKDATLAFAGRLKELLTTAGFSVQMTRGADGGEGAAVPGEDARVELANRSHAGACVLIHAVNGGHGVHLYTSALRAQAATPAVQGGLVPWGTAQAASLVYSQGLANDLETALNGTRMPHVAGRVSVKPIDSLTCPAVLVELAPLDGENAAAAAYQARVATAVAQGLGLWRGHAEARLRAEEAARGAAGGAPGAEPAAKPKPKKAPAPEGNGTGGTGEIPVRKPAPIIRREPPAPATPPTSPPGGGR